MSCARRPRALRVAPLSVSPALRVPQSHRCREHPAWRGVACGAGAGLRAAPQAHSAAAAARGHCG
eukprot:5344279-Alexandrium_andersonii.AAC.1